MPERRRVGDLEVSHDFDYQRREWVVQRLGWAAMGLVVLGGLLGVFGEGPLSKATTFSPDGLVRVEYDRFLQYHNPCSLRVIVEGGVAEQGVVRLWLGRDYVDRLEIQQVAPEPTFMEAAPDGHVFVFRVTDPDRPVLLNFQFEPDRRGPLPGRIGLDGCEPARFRHFVYP